MNTSNNRTLARFVMAIAFIAAAFGTSNAQADDGHLVFSTAAYHFKNFNERNAFTPGIGWEYSPTGKLGFHVGTLSDSFGAQAGYAGINYGTRRFINNRVRFLLGASVVYKQYHKNADLEAKIVPFPVMEIALSKWAKFNITGSPELDYAGSHSNAVMFFQFKMNLM